MTHSEQVPIDKSRNAYFREYMRKYRKVKRPANYTRSPVDLETKYIPEPNTGCWLWLCAVNETGYGRFTHGGKSFFAHRYVYEIHKGPVPDGLVLDHLCRQRSCVNPDHLEPVTQRENLIRGLFSRGEMRMGQPFCKHGHALTPENIYNGRGKIECRPCRKEAKDRFLARLQPRVALQPSETALGSPSIPSPANGAK